MKRFLPIFIILLQLIANASPTFAAPKASGVGVVFSGGGAKGLYHVGVLEALEEYGIPIDFVAGTSMGANIGAMYAAGYSPAQMRELALSGNLEKWSSGHIERSHGAYFRAGSTLRENTPTLSYRTDPMSILNSESNEPDGKNKMAQSLISTTQIDLALTELFTDASAHINGDFSKLMVPFLCVASDVTNNRPVIMQSGNLSRAVRASMAIPVAFTPVIDEDGNMLYDGGIQNNFPWQPLLELYNPRIIIGSTCGKDKWATSKSPSIFDQILKLTMNPNDFNLPDGSFLIARDVPGGTLDFATANTTIQMGYDDTVAQIDEIVAQFKPNELKSKEFYDQRREEFRAQLKPLLFDSYEISGVNERQKEFLEGYMETTLRRRNKKADKEKPLEFNELKHKLLESVMNGGFNTSFPQINYNNESETYSFEMEMEHKPSLLLSIGGNLSSTPFNQLYISSKYTYIGRTANTIFAELYLGPVYNTGRIGGRVDTYKSVPLFLDLHYNFAAKNLSRGDFNKLTKVDNTASLKSLDQYLSAGVGTPIRQRSLLLARFNIGKENLYYDATTTDPFDKTSLSYAALKIEVAHNTLDDEYFPTSGSRISLSAIGVFGHEASHEQEGANDTKHEANRVWSGAKIKYDKYLYIGRKKIFNLGVNIESVYTTTPKTYTPTGLTAMLPTYQPTTHSKMIYMPSYSAARYLGIGLRPSFKIWRELHFSSGFYTMLRDKTDGINTYTQTTGKGAELLYSAEATVAYKTPLGPVRLSLTKYDISSKNNMYLTLNFGYTIFAPRGTFY
ncbi:MAG: patatin-like phospholipase family protein [Rikenellaceae bacterium]